MKYPAITHKFVEKELSILNDLLKSMTSVNKPDKKELIKAWLISCLAKTLKEQVSLTNPIPRLVRKKCENV